MKPFLFFIIAFSLAGNARSQIVRKPIPDKVIVLTFDDAVVSHATYVAPLLKKYGFGATFYIADFSERFCP